MADSRKICRTRIYIDGYNLYYGCLRGTPYKWLNVLSLFKDHIIPTVSYQQQGDEIEFDLLPCSVKFFTAKIVESAAKGSDSVSSQARYHTALGKVLGDKIDIVEGYYSVTQANAKLIDSNNPRLAPKDCRDVTVWKLEEKQSDVNLALNIYHDALTKSVDAIIVVTNDTDIAPALKMVRENTDVLVGLVIPTTDAARVPNVDLSKQAHWVRRHILTNELVLSQLPRVIGGRKPTVKPLSWYPNPEIFGKIVELAIKVKGKNNAAFQWLEQANPHFGGMTPMKMVETPEGAQQVLKYIEKYISDKKI